MDSFIMSALVPRASFLFLGLLVVCSGCTQSGAQSQDPQVQPAQSGAVPVTVGQVVRKAMPLDLQVIGTVEPASTVSVYSRTTGQLEEVRFREGDEVRAGQVLFTIDRRPMEAAVKQAEATLQRDTAQAANARAQAQRFLDLQARGIATREQLDTSAANAEALEATLGADRAALENARIQLDYATISAPISGRTGALIAHSGSLVRANDTTPLVVINQLSPINVSFAVPEAQLATLKQHMARGTSVPIIATSPDAAAQSTTGRLTFIDNTVDITTGTIKAKGSFANSDHQLWPGQFVNVTLTLATDADAVVAPTLAVQSGQDGTYVYLVKPDQTVEMRTVTVRRTSGAETVIASGLEGSETVVTDGHLRLTPGARVSVKSAAEGRAAE